MDDEAFADWETVVDDIGEKIEWQVGTVFIGTYNGVRHVELEAGDESSKVPSARFTATDGTSHWCWMPYGLRSAVDNDDIIPGDKVRIECTGEQETKRGLNPVKTFDIKRAPRG